MSRSADFIVLGEWVLPDSKKLMNDAGLVIKSDKILEVGPQSVLLEKYPDVKRFGGKDCLILPGFISTHTHLFQTFLKGVGQGLSLRPWVQKVTSPASIAMTPKDAYLSASIGILDALRSGTTSIFDFTYAFPDDRIFEAIVQAFVDLGARGWLGIGVNDSGQEFGVHPDLILPLDQIISRLDRLSDAIRIQSQGLVEPAIVTSSIRGLSSDGLKIISQYATDKKMIFSAHINETSGDNEISLAKFGKNLIPALAELQVLNEQFLAVHCVSMTAEDISTLATNGAGVSHNPVSNMYLGSGIAPVLEMTKAGVPVSLGVDGAASNNSQDMLENLKFTVLGQRVKNKDINCMHAIDAIRMATLGGANILQVEKLLGKLEPDFKADFTVLRLDTAKTNPVNDPIATTVFNSSPENVDTIIVNGKIILQSGKIINLDEEKIIHDGRLAARDLLGRTKIQTR